jgi:hypothetical protein
MSIQLMEVVSRFQKQQEAPRQVRYWQRQSTARIEGP